MIKAHQQLPALPGCPFSRGSNRGATTQRTWSGQEKHMKGFPTLIQVTDPSSRVSVASPTVPDTTDGLKSAALNPHSWHLCIHGRNEVIQFVLSQPPKHGLFLIFFSKQSFVSHS